MSLPALNKQLVFFLSAPLIAGLSLGIAWIMPGTITCAALGWLFTIFFILSIQQTRAYTASYLCGLISHAIAFHWIFGTIANFGGFPSIAAAGIFALFVCVSALQFPLSVLFSKLFEKQLQFPFILSLACAWVVAEFVSIRIFPWHLGHTQAAFLPFAQWAEIGGSQLLSFFMIFFTACYFCKTKKVTKFISSCVAVVLIGLGTAQYSRIADKERLAPSTQILLVQANVPLEEKHDPQSKHSSGQRYKRLTLEALEKYQYIPQKTLVVWPETALVQFFPYWISDRIQSPYVPKLSSPLIFGALSRDESLAKQKIYNSAITVIPDGAIRPLYHKRILMPFGEYTPLGNYLPWLEGLNNTIAQFTAGTQARVFDTTLGKVSPLICYEDIAPPMARESTLAGAEILLNMTNDAWFGKSAASRQHEMIALFRAIENRRSLVRVTNTGTSGVILPSGKVLERLPDWSEQYLLAQVPRVDYKSVYTTYVGENPRWCLLTLVLIAAGLRLATFRIKK